MPTHLELIRFRAQGEAKQTPILLLHGAWHGAWCWLDAFAPTLAERGYHTFVMSLRGHGNSPGREQINSYRIADYVEDLHDIVIEVEAQTGQKPVVIGHSMGGFICQKYLEAHSLPGVVLLATIPREGFLPTLLRLLIRSPLTSLRVGLTRNSYFFVATPQAAREKFYSSDFPDDKLQKVWEPLQQESFRSTWEVALTGLPQPERVKAQNPDMPMLVLGGADDAIFYVPQIEGTARAYGTEAVIFPDMAHNMMLERGWESVLDRIADWLTDHAIT
ncbi:MAG: alpha/beta hydrolase [Chloroflexi bacterium]|nr:alpha/beta hydrolase [Chloroflexota bacterium]